MSSKISDNSRLLAHEEMKLKTGGKLFESRCENNADKISWNEIFFAILQTHILIYKRGNDNEQDYTGHVHAGSSM